MVFLFIICHFLFLRFSFLYFLLFLFVPYNHTLRFFVFSIFLFITFSPSDTQLSSNPLLLFFLGLFLFTQPLPSFFQFLNFVFLVLLFQKICLFCSFFLFLPFSFLFFFNTFSLFFFFSDSFFLLLLKLDFFLGELGHC